MTEEHREIIATKCSHPDKKKKFPNLPTNPFYSKKSATSVGGKKQAAAKPASKISEKAMFYHRKWQAEAEKQGGPNAKIVVSKPEAKKIIFNLFDEGVPMNINEM